MLRERITSREDGKMIGRPDRVTFQASVRGSNASFEREGSTARSCGRKQALAHLERFFGAERRANEVRGISSMSTSSSASRRAGPQPRPATRCAFSARRFRSPWTKACSLSGRSSSCRSSAMPGRGSSRRVSSRRWCWSCRLGYSATLVRFLRLTGWRRDRSALACMGIRWTCDGETIRLAASDPRVAMPGCSHSGLRRR